MTQQEKVLNRIKEIGYVSNFWAIENYVLRLGAIIHTLSKEKKMVFKRVYGKELGKPKNEWKNFYYFDETKKQPELPF